MSRFAAFGDAASSSDEEEAAAPASQQLSLASAATGSRQAGGRVAIRVGEIDPVLGFSPKDLEATCSVVKILGENPHLFKLPQLKSLRGALHPLIVEQMKNYAGSGGKSDRNRGGNKRRRGNNGKASKGGGAGGDESEDELDRLEREYINQTQLRAIRLQQVRVRPNPP